MRDLHGGWRQGVRREASYILSDEEWSRWRNDRELWWNLRWVVKQHQPVNTDSLVSTGNTSGHQLQSVQTSVEATMNL